MSEGDASLGPLLQTLREDAEHQAAAIVAEARREADELLERGEEQARALEASAEAEGRAAGEREARRRTSLARIAARREALSRRGRAVQRAVEQAARRLAERAAGAEAEPFLAALVASAQQALAEPRLRVRVREEDVEIVRRGLAGVDVELRVDPEALDEPGVVVTTLDGRRRVDASLSGLMRRRGTAARRAAAQVLFGAGPLR